MLGLGGPPIFGIRHFRAEDVDRQVLRCIGSFVVVFNIDDGENPRSMRPRPRLTVLLNVAIFIRAGARRQIARLAENPNAWHKRITGPPNRIRRNVS
jgi:hypothetical protein